MKMNAFYWGKRFVHINYPSSLHFSHSYGDKLSPSETGEKHVIQQSA